MLPDFIELKLKLAKGITRYAREKTKGEFVIGQLVRTKRQHEGKSLSIKTFDGHESHTEYKEVSSGFKVDKPEIIEKGIFAFFNKLDKMAADMAKQQSEIFYEKMAEVTDMTGNVVDCKNEGLSGKALLAALEKIQVDFDEKGLPEGLSFVFHPSLKGKIAEINADLEVKKAWDALMAKKKGEWHDRESNRKLVD